MYFFLAKARAAACLILLIQYVAPSWQLSSSREGRNLRESMHHVSGGGKKSGVKGSSYDDSPTEGKGGNRSHPKKCKEGSGKGYCDLVRAIQSQAMSLHVACLE